MLSHTETLQRATEACRTRQHWSAFFETPSTKLHGETAPKLGLQAFEQQLGRPFELDQPGEIGRLGKEVSPYTQEALGIDYPAIDVGQVCQAALKAMRQWQKIDPDQRALIGVEMLRALEAQLFENSHATMHTAGQSFMMGFVGSGANALDRGLEALVYAHKAMTDLPQSALWQKSFGSHTVALEKRYHFVPRGIALVICCASFPAWNAYPAIMANLVTGNPVVLKPHPGGILPMAISVRAIRRVLEQHNLDPNLVTMAADTRDEPIAGRFLERADVGIVDFTGSQRFGSWLEQNVRNKRVYTETSGVNSVVIESTPDLDGMVDAIAHSLCLFSAQMCTSPQNIHLPKGGIESDQGHISAAEVAERILARVEERASNPVKAAAICGALQSDATLHLLDDLHKKASSVGRVLRASGPYQHPEFPNARTATPLIIEATQPDHELLQDEHFGPASFIITHDSAEAALASAAATALKCGAIATHVYSSNADFQDQAEAAFVAAGASTTFNLSGPMPLNYAAAYSDLHVTGLNPAGNACLTDLAFVCDRFRIVQARWPEGSR
ncbi:MAG TPA: aldehyde dehydrogenase family protein [Xanthomonadales bacterium]|nr:aldehyde dehydrogenase family protein [Xanthomonadales bacterium]